MNERDDGRKLELLFNIKLGVIRVGYKMVGVMNNYPSS